MARIKQPKVAPAQPVETPAAPQRCASVTLPADKLRRALQAVLPAASRDLTRGPLAGIAVEIASDHVEMTVTDGHRLHTAHIHAAEPAVTGAFIVHPNAATEFVKVLHRVDGLVVLAENKLTVPGLGAFDFVTLVGQFPNWQRVVPTHDGGRHDKAAHVTRVNPNYLCDALAAAKRYVREHPGVLIEHMGELDPWLIRPAYSTDPAESFRAVVVPMRK